MTQHLSTTSTVTVDELQDMLADHRPVTVLDVRPAADRAEWAIPGSIHIDAYDALKAGDPEALAGLQLPEGSPVVTVCAAGKTSLIAMDQLRERGYDARSLAGGMRAWSLAWNSADVPLPTGSARVLQVRRTGKGCLSYLIGDGGQAAVIDPSLDPGVYQELATRNGWTITHVLETHIHADHLSRARMLADLTGAVLHLPETVRVAFPHIPLRNGAVIDIGAAHLDVMHTPGHTLESTSYLLDGIALFTGDTLFLTGVGRPDLEAKDEEARERAHLLWLSLRRLAALPGETIVLPGHTSSPVGFDAEPVAGILTSVVEQVPMMRLDEASFVETILSRIPPAPPNHATIVAFNEAGALPAGDPTDLEAGANRCAVS